MCSLTFVILHLFYTEECLLLLIIVIAITIFDTFHRLLYEYCVAGRLALAVVRTVRDISVQGLVPVYSISSNVFDFMQPFKPKICWLH